jgi:hypothetical protein
MQLLLASARCCCEKMVGRAGATTSSTLQGRLRPCRRYAQLRQEQDWVAHVDRPCHSNKGGMRVLLRTRGACVCFSEQGGHACASPNKGGMRVLLRCPGGTSVEVFCRNTTQEGPPGA